jgi:hypothetical protein
MPYYGHPPDYEFDSCHIIPNKRSASRFTGSILPPSPTSPDPVTVLAAIHLASSPTADIIAWLQGQGVPQSYLRDMDDVKILSVFEANSSIIIFQCPITTWLHVPPKVACTFIGLIRSETLLKELDDRFSPPLRERYGSGFAMGGAPYDEEWIPAHHIQGSETKRVDSGTLNLLWRSYRP